MHLLFAKEDPILSGERVKLDGESSLFLHKKLSGTAWQE